MNKEKKKKELMRVASIADSLYYYIDELMRRMEVEDGTGGFDVTKEDEDAFIAIYELSDAIDEHRWRIRSICDKLNKQQRDGKK